MQFLYDSASKVKVIPYVTSSWKNADKADGKILINPVKLIRRVSEDNLGISFIISPFKHTLWVRITIASAKTYVVGTQ